MLGMPPTLLKSAKHVIQHLRIHVAVMAVIPQTFRAIPSGLNTRALNCIHLGP